MKKIKLTKNKHALVDNEDFEYLSQWKWHTSNSGYAIRNDWNKGKTKKLYMHRIINETPDESETDHINRNRLDNRRINLRTVNHRQNIMNSSKRLDNTSGYKGINRQYGKWRAYIYVNSKYIHLGYFKSLNLALKARREAELKTWGN